MSKFSIIINTFFIFFTLLEFVFSFFRKDHVHKIQTTSLNIQSFVIGLLFKNFVLDLLYISFLVSFLTSFSRRFIDPVDYSFFNFFLCFLLLDFIFYITHRMYHKVSFFWAVHFTHHSDRTVNSSTFLRSSWVQKLYQWFFISVPIFIGFPTWVVVYCLSFMYFYQLLIHSPYFKFPKCLDKIIVTPRSHSLHHDTAINNQNCNFGEVLNIWDVMFGTYAYKDDKQKILFGVSGYKVDSLWSMQTVMLKEYFSTLFNHYGKKFFSKQNS